MQCVTHSTTLCHKLAHSIPMHCPDRATQCGPDSIRNQMHVKGSTAGGRKKTVRSAYRNRNQHTASSKAKRLCENKPTCHMYMGLR